MIRFYTLYRQKTTPHSGIILIQQLKFDNMDLKFPELRGGTVQGLNDAGVENFQGAIDVYLSRECGQNTGDAPRANVKTVRLEFDRLELSPAEIPGFEELRKTLTACLERWKDKEKERQFFANAVELANKDKISVLKISDYGTTGLTGGDLDEQGRWFALVKSQGVSNKGDTAGGSFGIGKSSPFAASRFRTVFYGTKTESGEVALQGVSRLVTHKNADARLTQGTGFIGNYDPVGGEGAEPAFLAVRDEAKIPALFRRTEAGTDIWVIGYRSGEEWSSDLTKSILINFWPAIHRGSIQFRVGDKAITKSNLSELIESHTHQEEFEAHYFYKAIMNQPIEKKLFHTGTCELYLTASSPDLPRKICMVRSSGMRIYDYVPRACRVPFSGLFICTDVEGNKLLRKLEPPKHDTWDPKRIEDLSGKRALDEIKIWIREEVKKLNPLFMGSSFNESELAKYLPDTSNDQDDVPNEDIGQSQEERLEPKPRHERTTIDLIKPKPVVVEPGEQLEEGGTEQFGTGGEGGGGENENPSSGDGDKGGGSAEGSKPPSLKVRSYQTTQAGEYVLVLRSEEDFSGSVSVQAIGEDGIRDKVRLQKAKDLSPGGSDFVINGDSILNTRLAAGEALKISVVLQAPSRRALTAILRR